MKRNIKWALGVLVCSLTLLIALAVVFIQPARLSPRESLAAGLVGVTNGVVFMTVTNRSDKLLTVHVVCQSHSLKDDWHTVASAQYPPLAGRQTRLVKIGFAEGTNGQRVMVLCSPTAGRMRQRAFEYCVKLKTKWLIPMFWPQTQEAAIFLIKPKHEGA